ncbi:MAG: nucleoside recognition domain-containing protein [archaeon]
MKDTFKAVFMRSLRDSLKVSWMLIKVFVPLSIVTVFLKQIGVIDYIAPFFAPVMQVMGLPGETAITLLAACLNNIFAGLATMAAFDLTFREITILGVAIGIAHNLFVETGILMKLKMARPRIAVFRVFIAVVAGVVLNQIMPESVSGVVMNPFAAQEFSWVATLQGLMVTCAQIIVVLFLLTLGYELLTLWKRATFVKDWLEIFPRMIGLGPGALGPWMVGMFIGISYGAGILYRIAHKLSHKDKCLITVFLIIAHAVIEDTMLVAVLGGNFWWILVPRVVAAVAVVRLLSIGNVYKRFLWIGLAKG